MQLHKYIDQRLPWKTPEIPYVTPLYPSRGTSRHGLFYTLKDF